MSKYKIYNSKVGAIGDGAIAVNTNFNSDGLSMNEFDFEELKKEVLELKNLLDRKEQKEVEDYKLLANVAEISGLVDRGDKRMIIDKIKLYSSQLFYKMSIGIGSGVLSNLLLRIVGI